MADGVETAILDIAEEYDTVCVGVTRSSAVTQALFGSIPETIGEQVPGTVVMARGQQSSPLSIREAIVERLQAD